MASKNPPPSGKASKSLPTSRETSPTSTKRILKDFAKRHALRFFRSDSRNEESLADSEQHESREERERRADLEKQLENFSLTDQISEAREKLSREQRERAKLEEKIANMEKELKSLKGDSVRDLSRTINAFTAVSDTTFEQGSRIENLAEKLDRLESLRNEIEKRFEEWKESIPKMQARDEREIASESSDSDTSEEEYENFDDSPPKIGTKKVKKVGTGRSGSKRDLFEALKSLKSLVPWELDDRHASVWVDSGATGIREFFPSLSDQEVMELLIRRLPKKYVGVNSRGLYSCRTLEDFKKRVVAMCTHIPTTGSESVVKFLNFVPTKIGPKTETFRALIVEILEEAEPLNSLGEEEISQEMIRGFIIEKCLFYMPYSIQAEISSKGLKFSKKPLLEDLQEFICSPIKTAEVERHLKTLKGENKGKQIGSVVSDDGQAGGVKKFSKRPKNTCTRCGSGIHLQKECNLYPERFNGQPCGHCRKANGFNLFHAEDSCVQSPK